MALISLSESWKSKIGLGVITLLGVCIAIALIMVAQRHFFRIDLTQVGRYSLTPYSAKIAAKLKEPVSIKAFYGEGQPEREKAREALELYRSKNPRLQVEFIDPTRKPAIAREYDIRSYGTLILISGTKRQTIHGIEEEAITNALSRLASPGAWTYFLLTGHGEKRAEDSGPEGLSLLAQTLEKEGVKFQSLNLIKGEKIPADASAILVMGPAKDLFPDEIKELTAYLNQGGRLILALEPEKDGGCAPLLKNYGISLTNNIIVDKLSKVMGGDYLMPVIAQYGIHPITDGFKLVTFFPTARALTLEKQEKTAGPAPKPLAFTSAESFAETNFAMLKQGRAQLDGKDVRGPLVVAAIVENIKKADQGTLVVFGDADFVANAFFKLAGNSEFFINTLHYLFKQETLSGGAPKKKEETKPLFLTRTQGYVLFFLPVVIIPGIFFATGIFVFRRMRRGK